LGRHVTYIKRGHHPNIMDLVQMLGISIWGCGGTIHWDVFYGVVPLLPIWEFIEGFFNEDILELLEGRPQTHDYTMLKRHKSA